MTVIYDLVTFIFTLFYLPLYLVSGKFHRGFSRRLGILPAGLDLNRPVWIHAVSVGEASAVKKLVQNLRKIYPGKKLVISTVTSTGNKIAQSLVEDGDLLTYLPLDFSFIVRKVIGKIDPCLFIIAETELWPNLISCLYRRNIPVITVNGRISDGSFRGYRAAKSFLKPVLNKISRFCMQTESDADRLVRLGVKKEKIKVTGNVKFDIDLENRPLDKACRNRLWLTQDDKLLVCGSTHKKEEDIILNAYSQLLVSLPSLKLLIAPRHPERSRAIGELVKKSGFVPIYVSGIPQACPTCANKTVFILDVIGQLFNYYACADVVFMGGSLVKKGGHNIIEPASLKKPVIFGPHMFNFRKISEIFLKNNAALMVYGAKSLVFEIKRVFKDDNLAQELGSRAYKTVQENCGATMRTIRFIQEINPI